MSLLDRIEALFTTIEEIAFFSALKQHKQILYDWGYDALWVWPSGSEEPVEGETPLYMDAEDLIIKLAKAQLPMPIEDSMPSAQVVITLLALGLNVSIANRVHEEGYLSELVAGAATYVAREQVGTVQYWEHQ